VTPDQLSDAFVGALRGLVEDGAVAFSDEVPDRVVVRRPHEREHGDYASNVALQLAGPAGREPRELAGMLANRLAGTAGIEAVAVAGPGFVNVRLAADAPGEVAARVVSAGPSYGGAADVMAGVEVPEELVQQIGPDAARYATARHATTGRLDLDLWSRASSDNPVYDVQLAHSRTVAILRNAAALGVVPADHPALLRDERERDLLLALADLPGVVTTAASLREPHRLTRFLEGTVAAFHRFHDSCCVLPVGDERPTPQHQARLLLVAAARVVLANGLHLLGVRAPERM